MHLFVFINEDYVNLPSVTSLQVSELIPIMLLIAI